MTEQPPAPAGWYPHGGGQRYWDGRSWTDHMAPLPSPPLPTHIPAYGTGPMVNPQPGLVPYVQVAPKNPGIALLASFFLPGLGTMINGEAGKGIAILLGYFVSWMLVIVFIGIFGIIGFWIWGMVDAYQGAVKWNARHGILS
jgi:TM2 domain-containing membrane protein YozV